MNQKDLSNMSIIELNHELLYVLISTPINVEKVRQLVAAGADLNEGIFLAKDTGNPEIMQVLIDVGVDANDLEINQKNLNHMNMGELEDELCNTLISPPVNIDKVRQLIAAGVYLDEFLFNAIDTGKLEIVKIFVEAGANVNYMDDDFEIPLLRAKNALLRVENGEYDEAINPEYNEIVAYLEELTDQETKDLVEEIMRQNDV